MGASLEEGERESDWPGPAQVDIDQCGDAAAEHGVTAVPSLLCFHAGDELERFQGAAPQRIRAFITGFLAQARPPPPLSLITDFLA